MSENFGMRIEKPGQPVVIKRKPGFEKPAEPEKLDEEKIIKNLKQSFGVVVDKNDRMDILPLKGSSREEQEEARAILDKLRKERGEFEKRKYAGKRKISIN